MDRNLREDIFRLYDQQFNVDSFIANNEESLLELLIIYHHKLGVNFADTDGETLTFAHKPDYVIDRNAIIIGGEAGEGEVLDELTSGFINNNIGIDEEDEKYFIYNDPEKKITRITKGDTNANPSAIYGYGTRQMFMSLITKLLPWHLGDLNEDQMVIVRDVATTIIGDNGVSKVEEIFAALMDEVGSCMKVQRKNLEKLGEKLLERRTENIRDSLRDTKRSYDEAANRMFEYNARLNELKIQLNAIENSQGDFENPIHEMVDFLDTCKYDFKIDHVTDEDLYLSYRLPLTVYSNDSDYEGMIKNGTASSMFIKKFTDLHDISHIKKAYERIMDEEKRDCTVWVSGTICVNMYNYRVHAENERPKENTAKHPHLNGDLSCFGSASNVIADYLKMARLPEAMNAMIYAARQFTLYDSYAARHYLEGIDTRTCIECPDGVFRNFHELIDMMVEEEEEE